jgi:PAS domain-containing protein
VQAFETRTPEGYVVAIRLDMTEQVTQRRALEQAQQEGQRARQLLLEALEALPEGLAVYDADDRLMLCNTQYRVMYSDLAALLQPGRPFDELIAYSVAQQHFGQDDQPRTDWGALRLARTATRARPCCCPCTTGAGSACTSARRPRR